MELANVKLAELAAKYEENARDENRTQRARRYCINIANTLDNVANAEAIKLEKVAKDFAAKAEALTRRAEALTRRAEELIKETRGISGHFALMAHTAERAADTAAAAALYYEAADSVAEIAKAVKDAEEPEKYRVRYIAKDGAVLSYYLKTDAAFRLYYVRNVGNGAVIPNAFAKAMAEAEASYMANPESSMARHGGVNKNERCMIEQVRTGRTEYFPSYFAGIGH